MPLVDRVLEQPALLQRRLVVLGLCTNILMKKNAQVVSSIPVPGAHLQCTFEILAGLVVLLHSPEGEGIADLELNIVRLHLQHLGELP